ncbi:MAG: phosphotransferase family protein [Alphaproteobacteria bacterium]|nr:phosphotransferase family protein [Alphaproteobacteria bacterium]
MAGHDPAVSGAPRDPRVKPAGDGTGEVLAQPDLAALESFLANASGAEAVEIIGFELLAGGAIQENWGFDARFRGGSLAGAQQLVLRTNAATGVSGSLSRLQEFAVLRAVFGAGVTVPEPLFVCADPEIIGKPFFVMRRLAGNAIGRDIARNPALDPVLPGIAERLGRELAKIQRIRPPRPDLAFLPDCGPQRQIATCRAYLDAYPMPRPVLEWGLRWLETHAPPAAAPVLCHRDFRTGNYMLDSGPDDVRLTAILDWEFAGWGDPDEDIGWFCCKGWRHGRLDREAGGIADRAAFYRGYEAESGRHIDPARVFYWEVLANVRWAVIALQQSDRFRLGGARDLDLAITGRRATECELELLVLLDGEPPSATAPAALPPSSSRKRGSSGAEMIPERAEMDSRFRGNDGYGGAAVPNRLEGGWRDLPAGLALLNLAREVLLEDLLPLLPPELHIKTRLVATCMAVAARQVAAGVAPATEIFDALGTLYGPLSRIAGEGGARRASNGRACPGLDPGVRAAVQIGTGGGFPPHPDPLPPAVGEGASIAPLEAEERPGQPRAEGDGQAESPGAQPKGTEVGPLRQLALDLRNGAFENSRSQEAAACAILWRLTIAKLRESNPGLLAAHGLAGS